MQAELPGMLWRSPPRLEKKLLVSRLLGQTKFLKMICEFFDPLSPSQRPIGGLDEQG